jgi:hypothetical protein
MTTYVYRNGKLVEKSKAAPLGGLFVISDEMSASVNHADGRVYTSKAKFRAATKSMGCIEIGNEKIPERKPIKLDRHQRREHIRQAIYELRNGR